MADHLDFCLIKLKTTSADFIMAYSKVIIVEDDLDLLNNTVKYLKRKEFEATGTGCALDFFQTLTMDNYDIAVVDLSLPDKSGFEIVKHLRAHTCMGIIVLTARGSLEDKLYGYECGADAYFVKPIDFRELVANINNLYTRLGVRSAKALSAGPSGRWVLDSGAWTLTSPDDISLDLTGKELALLKALIKAKTEAVSRAELLQSLGYKSDNPYDTKSLDILVGRLRKKFKAAGIQEEPIKTVRNVGYSFSLKATLSM